MLDGLEGSQRIFFLEHGLKPEAMKRKKKGTINPLFFYVYPFDFKRVRKDQRDPFWKEWGDLLLIRLF